MNPSKAAASRQEQFEAVLLRYGAELSRLRGSRGVVRCILPGHDDRSPSLSLDLTAAVFHCFGCGRGGGLKTLMDLLVKGSYSMTAPRARVETELQRARRAVMQHECAAAARRAEWEPLHLVNAYIGRCLRTARLARTLATKPGSGDPRSWPLLERGAQVEREGLDVEAQLDLILADGRPT